MNEATIAAIWSAVAASCSAVAAIVVMCIQRRNLLESVRPELVLVGWDRISRGQGDAASDVITIKSIKNVGRGAAFHVNINSWKIIDNRPVSMFSTRQLPIIAPNESVTLDGEIILWWKNAQSSPPDNSKFIPIDIRIYAWDSRNMRHETKYSLLAMELDRPALIANQTAPGLTPAFRVTTTKSVWRIKMRQRLAGIPLMGALFREKQK